jgi:hypothetical protein
MQGQESVDRPPAAAPAEVLLARGIEVVDETGASRIRLGRLGEGEGAVYGVSVHARDAATGVHLTADATSAGISLSRRGDEIVDCRVFDGDGEAIAAADVGADGPLLSIEVAADGSVTVRLGGVDVVR